MNIKKHIPNFFTLCNLFCGCIAILLLFAALNSRNTFIEYEITNTQRYFNLAVLGVFTCCLIFDFLDGLSARILNAQSEIGKQLDSLADMVSFGLFPGLVLLSLLSFQEESNLLYTCKTLNEIGQETDWMITRYYFSFLPFLGILVTLFSALRLAKFNIDTEQSYYFKGLNTPANSIFIVSLYWIIQQKGFLISEQYDLYILILITIVSCVLLVSNLPLFALKFKNLSWKDNHYKFVFLGVAAVLLILLQISAVPILIVLYIVVSIIFRKKILNEGISTE